MAKSKKCLLISAGIALAVVGVGAVVVVLLLAREQEEPTAKACVPGKACVEAKFLLSSGSSSSSSSSSSSNRRRKGLQKQGRRRLQDEKSGIYAFASTDADADDIESFKVGIIDIAMCKSVPKPIEGKSSDEQMNNDEARRELISSGDCSYLYVAETYTERCEFDRINYFSSSNNCLGDHLVDAEADLEYGVASNGTSGLFKSYWDSLDTKLDLMDKQSLDNFIMTAALEPGTYTWGWVTFSQAASIQAKVLLQDGSTLYTKGSTVSSAYFEDEGTGVNRPAVVGPNVDMFTGPAEEALFMLPSMEHPNAYVFELGVPVSLAVDDAFQVDFAFNLNDVIGAFRGIPQPSQYCLEKGYCGWAYYCTAADEQKNLTENCCNPERYGQCANKESGGGKVTVGTIISLNSTAGAAWLIPPLSVTPIIHQNNTSVWVQEYSIAFDTGGGNAYEPDWGYFPTEVKPWTMRLSLYFLSENRPVAGDRPSAAHLERTECPDFIRYTYDFLTFGGTQRIIDVTGHSNNLTLASRYAWFSNVGPEFNVLSDVSETSEVTIYCSTGYMCSICNRDYTLPLMKHVLPTVDPIDLRWELGFDISHDSFQSFAEHWTSAVSCNRKSYNSPACLEPWSDGAAYGYNFIMSQNGTAIFPSDGNGRQITCRHGAEYYGERYNDCCSPNYDEKCPRGGDFGDWFYQQDSTCSGGEGWVCEQLDDQECKAYGGVHTYQKYTLADVFKLGE